MSRFSFAGAAGRAIFVVAFLLIVFAVAFAVPALTLAAGAPPQNVMVASHAQIASGDTQQDAVSGFLTLAIALVTGGCLAYVLDDLPFWKNWKPGTAWLKPSLTILFTALVGAGLATVQTNLLPQYFAGLPVEFRTMLAWAAVYLSSQLAHQYDTKNEAERAVTRLQARPQQKGANAFKSVLLLLLLGAALLAPTTTHAAAPDEIQNYLKGEPSLVCIAHDIGAPVEAVVAAKIKFDNKFGSAHGYAAGDAAWAASYTDRIQYFAGYLNAVNPLNADGALTQGCTRLVKAQQLLSALE